MRAAQGKMLSKTFLVHQAAQTLSRAPRSATVKKVRSEAEKKPMRCMGLAEKHERLGPVSGNIGRSQENEDGEDLSRCQARDALWSGRTVCKAPDEGNMSILSSRVTQQTTVMAAARKDGAIGVQSPCARSTERVAIPSRWRLYIGPSHARPDAEAGPDLLINKCWRIGQAADRPDRTRQAVHTSAGSENCGRVAGWPDDRSDSGTGRSQDNEDGQTSDQSVLRIGSEAGHADRTRQAVRSRGARACETWSRRPTRSQQPWKLEAPHQFRRTTLSMRNCGE